MICTRCWRETIKARWRGRRASFCTECGRLTYLDYRTGRLLVIWPGRRCGKKVAG